MFRHKATLIPCFPPVPACTNTASTFIITFLMQHILLFTWDITEAPGLLHIVKGMYCYNTGMEGATGQICY